MWRVSKQSHTFEIFLDTIGHNTHFLWADPSIGKRLEHIAANVGHVLARFYQVLVDINKPARQMDDFPLKTGNLRLIFGSVHTFISRFQEREGGGVAIGYWSVWVQPSGRSCKGIFASSFWSTC